MSLYGDHDKNHFFVSNVRFFVTTLFFISMTILDLYESFFDLSSTDSVLERSLYFAHIVVSLIFSALIAYVIKYNYLKPINYLIGYAILTLILIISPLTDNSNGMYFQAISPQFFGLAYILDDYAELPDMTALLVSSFSFLICLKLISIQIEDKSECL